MLPGQPLDGSGRVCIHYLVNDEHGPFVEPHVLHPVFENGQRIKNRLEARPTRGRLACDPKRQVAPVTVKGVTTVTMRSSSPDAVTCPKCMVSPEFIEAMKKLTTPTTKVEN